MYAIVKTGGKQYRVEEGKNIVVEKLEGGDRAAMPVRDDGRGVMPVEQRIRVRRDGGHASERAAAVNAEASSMSAANSGTRATTRGSACAAGPGTRGFGSRTRR